MRRVSEGGGLQGGAAVGIAYGERADEGRESEGQDLLDKASALASPAATDALLHADVVLIEVFGVVDGGLFLLLVAVAVQDLAQLILEVLLGRG